jgi:hypothetical protein
VREIYAFENSSAVPKDARDRYAGAWEAFLEAFATTQITGPDSVAWAAKELRDSLASMCNRVDPWLGGATWSKSDEEEYAASNQDRRVKRLAFLNAVRPALESQS